MAGPSGSQPGAAAQALQFRAVATGAQEVPPVATAGAGAGAFIADPTLRVLRGAVAVNNLRQVTEAHIHVGRPGENGPVVLFLFRSDRPVDILARTLITNTSFTAADLIGPLQGMPLVALLREMLAGNTYVNVHTTANPEGEIRGQIIR